MDKDRKGRRRLLRGAVVLAAVVVALVAWLATRGGGTTTTTTAAPEAAGRQIVSRHELAELSRVVEQPIYWAGPQAGTELEVSDLGEGNGLQVSYLPEGTETGKEPADVLTVGSYPLGDPAAAVEAFGKRPGGIVRHAPDGREVVSSAERPTSVYFASPDNRVEVEVYAASAERAMRLALSGRVEPVR